MNARRATRWFFLSVTLLVSLAAFAEVVNVEMSDGTKLATEYFLPQTGEAPFPTIFVRSVYGRNVGPIASAFTGQGYAFVIQDTRGRGDSEGKDMVFADDGWGEHKDGADTVAWIKKQDWCNGNIGTWGMSALGITQVLMAPATPDLKAQGIAVAATDFYGQLSYQGGVFRKSLCEKWITGQKSTWVLPIWKSHPTYDAFWEGYNADAQVSKVNAPAVFIGGWFDIFGKGTIQGFVTRQHDGAEVAKGNQKLIMGPWGHGVSPKVGDLTLRDNFNFDINAPQMQLYNHFLKGEDNGIMASPAVNYYTLGDVDDPKAPGNEWRTATDWPPFPTQDTLYYLGRSGNLSTKAPAYKEAKLTYTFDPANPCPTMGGANLLIDAGPRDQRKLGERLDVLKFATPELKEPVEVTGNVRVRLYVSTDAPDTDFTAKLVDIYPDGREISMLDGVQRLKFRNGFTKADPLPAGEAGMVEIDLWSISLIFNKGHKIGVQISSSNYPRFEVNPNTGEDFPAYMDGPDEKTQVIDPKSVRVANNTVYMDVDHPSALILPTPVATALAAGVE